MEFLLQSIKTEKIKLNNDNSDNKELKKYFIYLERRKIYLKSGKKSVKKAIEFFKTQSPMHEFKIKSKIRLDITPNNNWLEPNYLKNLIDNKKKTLLNSKNGNKYKYFAFFPDITSLSPYNTVLLQLIDDFGMNGERRKHILNPEYNYCDVSAMLLNSANYNNNIYISDSKSHLVNFNNTQIVNNVNFKSNSIDFTNVNNKIVTCNQSLKSSIGKTSKVGLYCVFS